ncbi:hypothetical protein DB30_07517 [Enhygromyxa salina]|uniref:Uncharacterized protein n=1 Tax=Enhygromyxa salina TaxID=215803 RepID=A0A0C1Z845_9BACT|nr:hypothetical protein DB30_07517 [Enhygromyxa salina]
MAQDHEGERQQQEDPDPAAGLVRVVSAWLGHWAGCATAA